jgi:hypothetical protein
MGTTPTLTQNGYVWVNDDGSESGSTLYTEGTTQDFDVSSGNVIKRVRLEADCTGNDYIDGFHLFVSRNSGAYSRVTTISSYVRSVASAETSWSYTDGSSTTDRMTTGSGTNTGYIDTDAAIASFTVTKNQHTQCEFCIEFVSADLADNDTLDFRLYNDDGTEINGGYTASAQSTITKTASGTTIDAAAGSVTVTGYAVEVEVGTTIDAAAGSVVATGYAVTVEPYTAIDAAIGSVTVTGYQATVEPYTIIDAAVGSVAVAGYAVQVDPYTTIDAAAGTITVTGYQALVGVASRTQVSPIGLIMRPYGNLDSKVASGTTISAAVGSVVATGYAVEVEVGTTIDAASGSITITGYAAEVEVGTTIDTAAGAITVTGYQATVEPYTAINATAGSVAVTGYAVEVEVGTTINAVAESVVVTGYQAVIEAAITINAAAGSVVITDYTVTITIGGTTIDPALISHHGMSM